MLEMDRLTYKDATGEWVINSCAFYMPKRGLPMHLCGEAVERLAKYEDTGLTPEEVHELEGYKEFKEMMTRECERMIRELEYERAIEGLRALRERWKTTNDFKADNNYVAGYQAAAKEIHREIERLFEKEKKYIHETDIELFELWMRQIRGYITNMIEISGHKLMKKYVGLPLEEKLEELCKEYNREDFHGCKK